MSQPVRIEDYDNEIPVARLPVVTVNLADKEVVDSPNLEGQEQVAPKGQESDATSDSFSLITQPDQVVKKCKAMAEKKKENEETKGGLIGTLVTTSKVNIAGEMMREDEEISLGGKKKGNGWKVEGYHEFPQPCGAKVEDLVFF